MRNHVKLLTLTLTLSFKHSIFYRLKSTWYLLNYMARPDLVGLTWISTNKTIKECVGKEVIKLVLGPLVLLALIFYTLLWQSLTMFSSHFFLVWRIRGGYQDSTRGWRLVTSSFWDFHCVNLSSFLCISFFFLLLFFWQILLDMVMHLLQYCHHFQE